MKGGKATAGFSGEGIINMMEYINSFLGHYQPSIQTVAALLSLAALIVVILALRKTDKSILIAKDTLVIINKDFERRYRHLEVEKIEYYFADYLSDSYLGIAIIFSNISQQDIVVKELNFSFRNSSIEPLKFRLDRVETVGGHSFGQEITNIPHAERRRVAYTYLVSPKEKKSFIKLSLKDSQLLFKDNNSNNYIAKVILDGFKLVRDENPEIEYS